MMTPELHLDTSFVRDDSGRILRTREPLPASQTLFCLVRGITRCVWSIHASLPAELARAMDELARSEQPVSDFRDPPVHAREYRTLLGQYMSSRSQSREAPSDPAEQCGPAMSFPDTLPPETDLVRIDDERTLATHFRGWQPGEIAGGRAPVLAVLDDGRPVSVCFCARSSPRAAEAGVETAEPYRGRGLGPRITAAWAHAIREQGRIPLYSTQWTNKASLAVARKLGLTTYATIWCLIEPTDI